ncbi:hypothetical protein ACQKCU_14075 [Heyndrickxia sporothermodurans]
MKKIYTFILLTIFTIFIFIIKIGISPTKEAITYFPLHEKAHFLDAETNLTLTDIDQKNKYTIDYSIYSKLDRKAYLRQDIGLLYKNGKLVKQIGSKTWKQNRAALHQSEHVKEIGSGYYRAISFHYGEIQEKHKINSVQRMSNDTLFVVHSKFQMKPIGFHTTETEDEKQWEYALKENSMKQIESLWKSGLSKNKININQYISIPLTELVQYNDKPLPGFSKKKSDEIIGKLWEGLYKNYILGIKKEDGTSVDPLGSTIPLLLLNENKKELLVLIITKDLEPILLKQVIQLTTTTHQTTLV